MLLAAQMSNGQSLSLFLAPTEGGKLKPHHQKAFAKSLQEYQCKITFSQDVTDANLILATKATVADGYEPLLKAKTYANRPLNLSVLVQKSRGVDALEQLHHERIAIIHSVSEMGFLSQFPELSEQGLRLEPGKVIESGRFDGALALLLHGDVFAALIPQPLAEKWSFENKLTIVAQTTTNHQPYLWLQSSLRRNNTNYQTIQNCREALLTLDKKTNHKKYFSIFPLWLEGFESL